jgi:hypothetical protein
MADIFVSYSSKDRERAKDVATSLERQGWSVWWDPQIPVGGSFDQILEEQIAAARSVVVLWSPSSVASYYVKNEAREANNRRILIPALIKPVKLPMEFSHIQTADLTAWSGGTASGEFDKLLDGLRALLGGPKVGTTLKDQSSKERAEAYWVAPRRPEKLLSEKIPSDLLRPLDLSGIVGEFIGKAIGNAKSKTSIEREYACLNIKSIDLNNDCLSQVSAEFKFFDLNIISQSNITTPELLSGSIDKDLNLKLLGSKLQINCTFVDIDTIQGKYAMKPFTSVTGAKYGGNEGDLKLTRTEPWYTILAR